MSDTTLYNKYRPKSFDDIIGQDHVVSVLQAHLINNTVPHSLIFFGSFGTGKTSMARILAKELNSHSSATIEKDSTVHSRIDDIRALQLEVEHLPFEGHYKTYIFDEAHRISDKSFDSLLKTIEEPPEHVKFIFVTSAFDQIPLSIKSRSECHSFSLLTSKQVEEMLLRVTCLEGIQISDFLISGIVSASRGALRNALVLLETVAAQVRNGVTDESILSTLGLAPTKVFENIVVAFLLKKFKALDQSVAVFEDSAYSLETILSDYQIFLMDLVRDFLYPQEIGLRYSQTAGAVSTLENLSLSKKEVTAGIYTLYEESLRLARELKYTVNKKALIDSYTVALALKW